MAIKEYKDIDNVKKIIFVSDKMCYFISDDMVSYEWEKNIKKPLNLEYKIDDVFQKATHSNGFWLTVQPNELEITTHVVTLIYLQFGGYLGV